MYRILVVDDEEKIRGLIRKYAEFEGNQVTEAQNGMEAVELCRKYPNAFDIIIMDVMMPELDGFSAVAEIRKTCKTPVLMLSARGEEYDRIHGFELGVDEYISKPFSPKILVARVEAILRRTTGLSADDILRAGGIEINKAAHQVSIDGENVDLSYKEFELLTYFVENQGIALSREKILNSVWNYDYFGDARTIDTHVKKLRSKLGSKGEYIKTIWGMGYKFEVDKE